jgi:hypothetical protein
MTIATTVASAFFMTCAPQVPGLAGAFNEAFFGSPWALIVAGAPLVTSLLLLLCRAVPLALTILAAFSTIA